MVLHLNITFLLLILFISDIYFHSKSADCWVIVSARDHGLHVDEVVQKLGIPINKIRSVTLPLHLSFFMCVVSNLDVIL